MLGSFAWIFLRDPAPWAFLAWILPHGIPELTAITLCAAGGLVLGDAVASPGRRGRRAALRAATDPALLLVGLALPLLALAAVMESFVRESALGTATRLAIAGCELALLLAGLWQLQRLARRRAHHPGWLAELAGPDGLERPPVPAQHAIPVEHGGGLSGPRFLRSTRSRLSTAGASAAPGSRSTRSRLSTAGASAAPGPRSTRYRLSTAGVTASGARSSVWRPARRREASALSRSRSRSSSTRRRSSACGRAPRGVASGRARSSSKIGSRSATSSAGDYAAAPPDAREPAAAASTKSVSSDGSPRF